MNIQQRWNKLHMVSRDARGRFIKTRCEVEHYSSDRHSLDTGYRIVAGDHQSCRLNGFEMLDMIEYLEASKGKLVTW